MGDKRDVMRLHIKNGIRDLNGIRESYNTFANGGNIYDGKTENSNQMQLSPLKPKQPNYSFVPESYSVKQQSILPSSSIDIKSLPDLSSKIVNNTSIGNTKSDKTHIEKIKITPNPYAFFTDKQKQELVSKNNSLGLYTKFNTDATVETIPNKLNLNKTANTLGNVYGNLKTYFSGSNDKNLLDSPYRPSIGDSGEKYYTRAGMKNDVFKDLTSEKVKRDYNHTDKFSDIFYALKNNGSDRKNNAENSFPKNSIGYKGMYNNGHGSLTGEFNLGRYKVDAGSDKNGNYISFSDKYDWNGLSNLNTKPINFYDRIYESE